MKHRHPLSGEGKPPLPVDGAVGPDCDIRNSAFGCYTDIGAQNRIQNTVFGDYSYTGAYCYFQNADVGKFSNIAAMVRVGPTAHPMDRPSLHHFTYRRRLYGFSEEDDASFFADRVARRTWIGHDTWLGHGAIVMPELSVGTGSVIGAGAVVTRDIPPYTVAVGVPAKPVKDRFSEAIASALLEIAWWEWTHETIRARLEDFLLPAAQFVEKYRGTNGATDT